jgi:hypothetical protein
VRNEVRNSPTHVASPLIRLVQHYFKRNTAPYLGLARCRALGAGLRPTVIVNSMFSQSHPKKTKLQDPQLAEEKPSSV